MKPEEIIKKYKLENHPNKDKLVKLIASQEKDDNRTKIFLRSHTYYLQEFDKAVEQLPNLVDIKSLKLRRMEKIVLYLNFWCDMKLTEIAKELKTPIRTIKHLKRVALEKLKKCSKE